MKNILKVLIVVIGMSAVTVITSFIDNLAFRMVICVAALTGLLYFVKTR